MTEVPHPCEHHRDPLLIRRLNHLIISYASAGLDDGGCARAGGGEHAVGEGEEGVRSTSTALGARGVPSR